MAEISLRFTAAQIDHVCTEHWMAVFTDGVRRGPLTTFGALRASYADGPPTADPPPETAQACVDRCAALADASEAKLRERLYRVPPRDPDTR